jgi:hypothetical protein
MVKLVFTSFTIVCNKKQDLKLCCFSGFLFSRIYCTRRDSENKILVNIATSMT